MLKATRFESPFVLISLTPTVRRNGNKVWDVYGWRNGSANDHLGEFTYEADALHKAFGFGLPVMKGYGEAVSAVAARLEPWEEPTP